MAFTAARSAVLGAGTVVALPSVANAAMSSPAIMLYSHMRVPGGTTYTFNDGTVHIVPASIDSVIAIPVGATTITATAASTCQFGQSL